MKTATQILKSIVDAYDTLQETDGAKFDMGVASTFTAGQWAGVFLESAIEEAREAIKDGKL